MTDFVLGQRVQFTDVLTRAEVTGGEATPWAEGVLAALDVKLSAPHYIHHSQKFWLPGSACREWRASGVWGENSVSKRTPGVMSGEGVIVRRVKLNLGFTLLQGHGEPSVWINRGCMPAFEVAFDLNRKPVLVHSSMLTPLKLVEEPDDCPACSLERILHDRPYCYLCAITRIEELEKK